MASTAAPLETLSKGRQKAARSASSVEEVFGLFYQEGDAAARRAFQATIGEREAAARRGGYRAGGADAARRTAERDAQIRRAGYAAGTADAARARTSSTTATSSSTSSTPALNLAGSSFDAPTIGRGMSAAQGRTLIVLMLALDALGAVANDVIANPNATAGTTGPQPNTSTNTFPPGTLLPPTTPGGPSTPVDPTAPPGSPTNPYNMGTLSNAILQPGEIPGTGSSAGGAQVLGSYTGKVPVHLRSLAGVLIVGTIALAVNELSPAFGVLIIFALTLDVGYQLLHPGKKAGATIPNQPSGGVYARLGSALIGAKPAGG